MTGGPPPGPDLRDRLRELVQESAGIPASLVTDSASLRETLALDSLSMAALQVNIESAFKITLSYDELCAADRFDRVAEVVEAEVRRSHGVAGR
ncbi:MAG TPA: acyl carrier protein [Thermomonospora sp.]|nr:acyl carrier protein [Thermomonospora sp.]